MILNKAALLAAVGGVILLLRAMPVMSQEAPVVNPGGDYLPVFLIEWRNSELLLAGDVSSGAHEAILWQTAATHLPDAEIKQELRRLTTLPPGWALVTDLTLRAVSMTHSSSAYVDATQVFIRGFTDDIDVWQTSADRIKQHLPPGMRLREDVSELRTGKPLDVQCTTLFEAALDGREIGFANASATLNSNSFALLDELVQLAADCPGSKFTVTGHTDSTGNESRNRQLSRQRAEAVVAYFAKRGINADRFEARGVGSAVPAVAGSDARAREANRRIEVAISFR